MLLEHADRLLAVATRLGQLDRARGMILEFAVCGRLLDTTELLADGQQLNSAPGSDFPHHWTLATLDELGETKPRNTAPDSSICGFLPMASVPTRYGAPMSPETRAWGAIRKGYTHVADGDVVLAKITPCFENGKSGVVKALPGGFGAGTTELHVFRADSSRVLPEYVALVLKTPSFIRRGIPLMTGSAGQKRVPSSYFGSTPIPLPPLAEQRRIVARVDELMALCDRLEAQLQERDARSADLAKAALAKFSEEPTAENLEYLFHPSFNVATADLRDRIRDLAVQGNLTASVSEDPRACFPGITAHEDATGDRGRQPKHWVVCKMRSLSSLVTSGSRGWKEYYANEGSIFIRTQNIKTDSLVLEDVAYVQLPDATEGKRAQVEQEDLLITITGANVTKAARVTEPLSEAYVSQHLALVRPRWPFMSPWLHLCLLAKGSARGVLECLAYGDKPGLNLDHIRELLVPVPPLAEQRRIVAKVEELLALVDQLEAQLAVSEEAGTKLLDALVAELAPSN